MSVGYVRSARHASEASTAMQKGPDRLAYGSSSCRGGMARRTPPGEYLRMVSCPKSSLRQLGYGATSQRGSGLGAAYGTTKHWQLLSQTSLPKHAGPRALHATGVHTEFASRTTIPPQLAVLGLVWRFPSFIILCSSSHAHRLNLDGVWELVTFSLRKYLEPIAVIPYSRSNHPWVKIAQGCNAIPPQSHAPSLPPAVPRAS